MKNPIYFALVACCVCAIPLRAMEEVDFDKRLLALVNDEGELVQAVDDEEIGNILWYPLIEKLDEILKNELNGIVINKAVAKINKIKEERESERLFLIELTRRYSRVSEKYKKIFSKKCSVLDKECAIFNVMKNLLRGYTLRELRLAEEKDILLR